MLDILNAVEQTAVATITAIKTALMNYKRIRTGYKFYSQHLIHNCSRIPTQKSNYYINRALHPILTGPAMGGEGV